MPVRAALPSPIVWLAHQPLAERLGGDAAEST
jgi:hypothetical protein